MMLGKLTVTLHSFLYRLRKSRAPMSLAKPHSSWFYRRNQNFGQIPLLLGVEGPQSSLNSQNSPDGTPLCLPFLANHHETNTQNQGLCCCYLTLHLIKQPNIVMMTSLTRKHFCEHVNGTVTKRFQNSFRKRFKIAHVKGESLWRE